MHNPDFVMITGASEGLGKALALECASRHMNLVLVALPGEALHELGRFIEKDFGVRVICYELDLTNRQACYHLFDAIQKNGIILDALINNAGMGGSHLFAEKDPEYFQRLIELNVMAPTLLTHLFLSQVKPFSPVYILNVSSLAACISLPRKQVYGGTKSYLLSFSNSLGSELKKKNVHVSTICPGGMNTTLWQLVLNRSLSGISRWSVMDPEDVAWIAIEGLLKKKKLIIPGWWNRFFMILDRIMPGFIKERFAERATNKQPKFILTN
jgi:short-subunit dehydrogenase